MGALTQLFFVSGDAPSGSVANVAPLVSGTGDAGPSFSTFSTVVQIPIPITGKIRTLAVQVPAASLTAGQSFDVTVVVNGVDSSMTVTLDSTHNSATTSANQPAIAANDKVWLKWTPTGSPTTTGWVVSSSVVFEAAAFDHYLITAAINTSSGTAGGLAIGARNVIGGQSQIMPCAGTINGFSVISNQTNTGVNYATYTLRKNGVDTAIVATNNGAANVPVSSTGAAVHFAAGDTIALNRAIFGSFVSQFTMAGIDWTPDNPGDFPVFCSASSNLGSAQTYPISIGQTALVSGAADSTVSCIVAEPFTATNMATLVSSAPIAGRHRIVTMRKNGADSGLTALDLTGGLTSAVSTPGSASWAAGDTVNFWQVPTGTPAATVMRFVATLNMAPHSNMLLLF